MKDILTKELLQNINIFSDFDKDELELIVKYFTMKTYDNDVIIKNDNVKELSIVLNGQIVSSLNLPGTIDRKHAQYNAGDFFGEMSLFGYKSPFDTFHASKKSRIISIQEKDLEKIIEEHSETAIKFISQIIGLTIQKLRRSNKFLADVVQWGENASRRVITDELTGVYNRLFLEDAIDNFFNISKSNNKPVSLFMIDIDNFRVINDTLGLKKGNDILTELISIVRDIISRHGIIARYGGDEFSILLPETDLKKAIKIAREIQKKVGAHNFSRHLSGNNIPITTSIGISSFPDTATDLKTFKEKADSSLYKAKEAGRNRVAYIK